MKTMFNFRKIIVSSFCLLGLVLATYAQTNVGNDLTQSPESVVPQQQHVFPREQDPIPLQYVGQPPLIPHSTEGYQVNRNANTCMNCHDIKTYGTSKATRISASHFVNNALSPSHYFCLACHVEQTNATPIVGNQFQPAP